MEARGQGGEKDRRIVISREQLGRLAETLGGLPVWGCLPGSLAQEAGIRYGDVVLSVNGKSTANMDEYLDARSLRNDSATVVLFRDGDTLSIHLKFEEQEPTDDASRKQQLRALSKSLADANILPTDGGAAAGEPETN